MSTEARRLSPSTLDAIARDGRVATPEYDRTALTGGIVHLGVGAFHRAHLERYLHDLATAGVGGWSVTGSGLTEHDGRMADILGAQDGLYTLVERSEDDAVATVIGSLTAFLPGRGRAADVIDLLADERTRIVSMTVTESGYPVVGGAFAPDDALVADAAADVPSTTFGVVARALELRRARDLVPFTVLTCDNLVANGTIARIATIGVARLRSPELADWLGQEGAFPHSMVDRITPATTDADRAFVRDRFGIDDAWPVVCEPFRQWALEDRFTCGRPAFEEVGVLLTDDVEPYEDMKLRLLNGSHVAIAYLAALAGIDQVHDALGVPELRTYMRRLMADEVVENLVQPAGIDLAAYREELVTRFSNPAIGDRIARLCMDGSSKMPTMIRPSIEAQLERGAPVPLLALAVAGWARYLQGRADDGSAIEWAYDPYLDEARALAARADAAPRAFLGYERAFGAALGGRDEIVEAFAASLASLRERGALATVRDAIGAG